MIEVIIFAPEAAEEIARAYDRYEGCEFGLGEEYLRSVEATVSILKRHPLLYPVVTDSFRRALIRRFPYEIFYEIHEDTIFIVSVFHCSQNPETWKRRLE